MKIKIQQKDLKKFIEKFNAWAAIPIIIIGYIVGFIVLFFSLFPTIDIGDGKDISKEDLKIEKKKIMFEGVIFSLCWLSGVVYLTWNTYHTLIKNKIKTTII